MSDSLQTDFLSLAEAARYLRLTPGYVYQLVHLRRLAFSKPNGGRLLFARKDLDEYVARGRRPADYELADKADALALRAGGRS